MQLKRSSPSGILVRSGPDRWICEDSDQEAVHPICLNVKGLHSYLY